MSIILSSSIEITYPKSRRGSNLADLDTTVYILIGNFESTTYVEVTNELKI